MEPLGYIGLFTTCLPREIDKTDEYFLLRILQGETSVYKLYSSLKNQCKGKQSGGAHCITDRGFEQKDKVMAYKNVHRRIYRMYESRLLAKINKKGGYEHGAINYGLTSLGLVYLFSRHIIPAELPKMIAAKYSENRLFNLFICPYFEKKTIENCTHTLSRLLENYLVEVSGRIRFVLNPSRLGYFPHSHKKPLDLNLLKNMKPPKNFKIPEGIPCSEIYFLDYELKWCIKSLIFKIATMHDDFIDWQGKEKEPSLEDKAKTISLLSKDSKFLIVLHKYEREFRVGFRKLTDAV